MNRLSAHGGQAVEYALHVSALFEPGAPPREAVFLDRLVPQPPGLGGLGQIVEPHREGLAAWEAKHLLVYARLRGTDPVEAAAARRVVDGYEPRDWYYWRLFHWGCGWEGNHYQLVDGAAGRELAFATAGEPAVLFAAGLSERWPKAEFRIGWRRESEPYGRTVGFRAGEAVFETLWDAGQPSARR